MTKSKEENTSRKGKKLDPAHIRYPDKERGGELVRKDERESGKGGWGLEGSERGGGFEKG